MTALWFIGFSLVWTGLLYGLSNLLTRGNPTAVYAQSVWRGAALFSILPWVWFGLASLFDTHVTFPVEQYIPIAASLTTFAGPGTDEVATSWFSLPELRTILLTLLISGWCVCAARFAYSQWRLQMIKSDARPAASLSTEHWADQIGLKTAPHVALLSGGSPFVAGLKERTIYIPEAVATSDASEFVIVHECTHLARGDLITRPLERLVGAIFWFSPFAAAIVRQLDYWREAVCDERSAQTSGAPVAYAKALALTARIIRPEPRMSLPIAAFILPQRKTLANRLSRLLDHQPKHSRKGLALSAALMAVLVSPLALAELNTGPVADFTHPVVKSKKARITSSYGKRIHPVTKQPSVHAGVDIGSGWDAPIYSPADGKVTFAGKRDGYGKTVEVMLSDGYVLRFAQLNYIKVKKDETISSGRKIGLMGASGKNAKGPHLHLEVIDPTGTFWDPEKVEGLTLIKKCCD